MKTVEIGGKIIHAWICPKCGLLRSSGHTHIHGKPLDPVIAKMIEDMPDIGKKNRKGDSDEPEK